MEMCALAGDTEKLLQGALDEDGLDLGDLFNLAYQHQLSQWDENRHPRGNQRNRGQFTSRPGTTQRPKPNGGDGSRKPPSREITERQNRENRVQFNSPNTKFQRDKRHAENREARLESPSNQQPAVTNDTPSRIAHVLKVINIWPTVTAEVVRNSGAGDRTAKTAMILATVLDNIVPMIPVGSVTIMAIASLINPRAPLHTVQAMMEKSPKAQQFLADARDLIRQAKDGKSKQLSAI